MAGAIRLLHNKMAAMAKPVGGQIGVALGLIEASRKPKLATVKYASPTKRSATASDPSGWARGSSGPGSVATLMPACLEADAALIAVSETVLGMRRICLIARMHVVPFATSASLLPFGRHWFVRKTILSLGD